MSAAPLSSLPLARGHWLLGHAREMHAAGHAFVAGLCHAGGGRARFRVLHRQFLASARIEDVRHWLVARHERYGRSFPARNGTRVLGPGLLTADGEDWLKHRRMLLPPFRRGSLAPVVEATGAAFAAFEARLQAQGGRIDPTRDMRRLALDVITRVLLSEPMAPAVADWFGAQVSDALRLLFRRNYHPLPLPFWLPTRAHRRLWSIKSGLDDYFAARIAARRRELRTTPVDILDAILGARDAATGEPLSGAQVLSEVKTAFVAGFETSATALTWAFYNLARHPEAAGRWHEELDGVLGGRTPGWEDLERLPYLSQVVHETLRLYPPVFAAVREALADDEMDGLHVPRGTQCLISIYGIHRSPEYWRQPERFDPARFAPGAAWEREAWLPFVVGKHQCIGNHFALLEMSMVLALAGQRYRVRTEDDAPLGAVPQITLVPDRPFTLRFEAR